MVCEFCEILERRSGKEQILFEDKEVVIAVRDLVLTPGQITVFPKKHVPILENVEDPILKKCAVFANKVSTAVFESFGSGGTNILIKNGLGAGQTMPHFGIEIIPRQEGDNLQLVLEGKPLAEDEQERTVLLLQEALAAPSKNEEVERLEDKKEILKQKEGQENYLVKSQRRIP